MKQPGSKRTFDVQEILEYLECEFGCIAQKATPKTVRTKTRLFCKNDTLKTMPEVLVSWEN